MRLFTKSLACSAARITFELLGNTNTLDAFIFWTASAISCAEGFIVCPPSITLSHIRSLKISSSPLPAQIASIPISFFSASSLALSARFSSSIFSILILSSSPSSKASESATPGVLVWTWTFTSSKSPIQITLSPMPISFSFNLSISASVVTGFKFTTKNSVQYANSISPKSRLIISELSPKTSSSVFLPSCASIGTSPSSASSPERAARKPRIMVISPTPPESTTPAFLSTGRSSGVLASASSPTSISAVRKGTKSLCLLASLPALSAISLTTVKIVPSLGIETAP